MKLIGAIRPTATSELVAEGHDRGSADEAVRELIPDGFEAVQVAFSMKAGITTATAKIRATRVEQLEAEGATYETADAALRALVPEGYVLLSRSTA